MSKSELESKFYKWVISEDLPTPTREVTFAYPRRWRFDFGWQEHKVAVEIDGGIWIKGRHSRGKGIIADCEKAEAAHRFGWRVYRVPSNWVKAKRPEVIETLRILLGERNDSTQ